MLENFVIDVKMQESKEKFFIVLLQSLWLQEIYYKQTIIKINKKENLSYLYIYL